MGVVPLHMQTRQGLLRSVQKSKLYILNSNSTASSKQRSAMKRDDVQRDICTVIAADKLAAACSYWLVTHDQLLQICSSGFCEIAFATIQPYFITITFQNTGGLSKNLFSLSPHCKPFKIVLLHI